MCEQIENADYHARDGRSTSGGLPLRWRPDDSSSTSRRAPWCRSSARTRCAAVADGPGHDRPALSAEHAGAGTLPLRQLVGELGPDDALDDHFEHGRQDDAERYNPRADGYRHEQPRHHANHEVAQLHRDPKEPVAPTGEAVDGTKTRASRGPTPERAPPIDADRMTTPMPAATSHHGSTARSGPTRRRSYHRPAQVVHEAGPLPRADWVAPLSAHSWRRSPPHVSTSSDPRVTRPSAWVKASGQAPG